MRHHITLVSGLDGLPKCSNGRGLPPGLQGYIDINLGALFGGGVQIGTGPNLFPVYLYGGVQSPGVSITIAPGQDVTTGWNAGIGGSVWGPIVYQVGCSELKNGQKPGLDNGFYEYGVGLGLPSPPLAPSSGGGWYVFPIWGD